MGGIRKPRKQYSVPRKRWDKARIESEKKLLQTYGLKNKRELRRFETTIRKKRENARRLLALSGERRTKAEKELFESIAKTGLLPMNASIDDVLSLQVEELLEKRLSTIVWRKNLARTIKQARQFITHGHIAVNGKKITSPSYIIMADEADKVSYHKRPMQIETPKELDKAQAKKDFESALPKEEIPKSVIEEKTEVSGNE